MTKSRMKGWIVALAALAAIGTAGTATAGYLTKGFTDWKVQEKQNKPDEGKKDEGGKEITEPEPVSPETPKAQARALGFSRGRLMSCSTSYDLSLPSGTAIGSYRTVSPTEFRYAASPAHPASLSNLGNDSDPDSWLQYNTSSMWASKAFIRKKAGSCEYLCFKFPKTSAPASSMVFGCYRAYEPYPGASKVLSTKDLDDSRIPHRLDSDSAFNYYVIRTADLPSGFGVEAAGSGGHQDFPGQTSAAGGSLCFSVIPFDLPKLIDGQTKELYIDVDRGQSTDSVIASISAKDLFGVDVPVTVTEGRDTFNASKIGVYTLKVRATDSYGQTANATLIVHICDYAKPEIRQLRPLAFTADKGQKLTYNDLAQVYFSVTDNGTSHGSSLTTEFFVDNAKVDSGYSREWKSVDYGSHTVRVHAKDGTGNEKDFNATLTVNDGTAPVLKRKDGTSVNSVIKIGVAKTFTMTFADIAQMFAAEDNVDHDVSDTITGNAQKDVDFFRDNHKVGSYTLTIKANDKHGNVVTQAIPVEFIADIPPVFIVADTLVYTDTANPLDAAQLNAIVSNALLAGRKNVSARVTDDGGYLADPSRPGDYNMTYEYTELNLGAKSMAIRRADGASEVKTGIFTLVNQKAEDVTKKDGKGKVKGFFRKISLFFEKLGNWFRGVFNHFDFYCFLDNDDYLAKYPVKAPVKESADTPAPLSAEGR